MNQEEYGKGYRRRVDLPIALLLALGYLSSMLWSQDPGYARDETYYFHAGKRYVNWVRNVVHEARRNARLPQSRRRPPKSLKRKQIERFWGGYGNNHEHPPLAKLLMGGSWWLFTQQWRTPTPKPKRTWWTTPVTLENRAFAERHWPGEEAVVPLEIRRPPGVDRIEVVAHALGRDRLDRLGGPGPLRLGEARRSGPALPRDVLGGLDDLVGLPVGHPGL